MNSTNTSPQMPTYNRQWTPEEGQAAVDSIKEKIQSRQMNVELLIEFGHWAEKILQDPSAKKDFKQYLKDNKYPNIDKAMSKLDPQRLAGLVAAGHAAELIRDEKAQEREIAPPVPGPVSPEQMQGIAALGQGGDTMLAHINPEEAELLKKHGGSGTVNPNTGLPEFGWWSDFTDDVLGIDDTKFLGVSKDFIADIAPIILPAVALFAPALIPAIGTTLGASAALAPAVGAAVISGGVTALAGGDIKQILSSAALSGLGTYITPIVTDYIAPQLGLDAVGSTFGISNTTLANAAGSAAVAGGFTALRGGTISQILAAATSGAAGSMLGAIAKNVIDLKTITNPKINQELFNDAVFAAADAKYLADQGFTKTDIELALNTTGLNGSAITHISDMAANGASAEDMAASLSNKFGGSTLAGKSSLYLGVTAAEGSITGGANVSSLEYMQRIEDATFLANDARGIVESIRSTNPNINRYDLADQVSDIMISAGVNQDVAYDIASKTISGMPISNIATDSANFFSRPGQLEYIDINDAQFATADANQLAEQGLDHAAIEQNLGYTGIPQSVASDIAGSVAFGDTPGQTIAQVTPPASPTYAGVSNENFIASDAYQLAQQGLSQSQIESALLHAGVDPFVAADAAQLAANGMPISTIEDAITQSGTTAPNVEITNPGSTVDPTLVPIIPSNTGAATRDYGTFTPAPPDPSWSIPLQYPGINPGLVGAAVGPAYNTTSPVQSQYYWGRQPYFAYNEDLANYNRTPMPVQPWGIQQGWFEQPQMLPNNVYGPNMALQNTIVPQNQRFSWDNTAATTTAATTQGLPYFSNTGTTAMNVPMQTPRAVNPNSYVYSIAPQASQYTYTQIPTAQSAALPQPVTPT